MNALSRFRPSLFAICIGLLTACASSGPQQRDTAPSRTTTPTASAPSPTIGESIVAALRASQDERDPERAFSFAEHALAQSPDRRELLWLAARLCGDVARCQPEKFEARLRKIDPGNGVVWTGPLSRAQEKQDFAAESHILEALSREARLDVYWNSLLWQGAVALRAQARQPPPKMLNGPLTNAINDVSNWLSAVIVPSLAKLASACDRQQTRSPQIAERCRGIAKVLQQGDTFAAEAVGIGIAERSTPFDSPSTIALAEHAEVLTYQHDAARVIMGEQAEREKLSMELIELMKKLRREQDVSLAVLRWAGQPLVPQQGGAG
jgi:hypothetical protein